MEKADIMIISKIAKRAAIFFPSYQDHASWMMDIEFAHIDIPLKLTELLGADSENFMHDVHGIAMNMNRSTFKLENCFVPRYAVTQ